MFKSRFTATLLAFSAIAGVHTAGAQQDNDQLRQQPAAAAQGQDRQPAQQRPSDQPQSVEARRIATDAPQQDLTVTQALVKKLHKTNNAEIQLAQLAEKKSDHEQLKQLAQTLVKDHQAMNRQLEQLVGAEKPRGDSPEDGQPQRVVAKAQADSQSALVPHQLCQLMDKAADNALEMSMGMLQKQEGQDFQMAFLAQQAVAHTHMLAELKAIQSSGPEELQQIAEQAIAKTEQHLAQTMQLAKTLQDQERQPRSGEPRTDRPRSNQPRSSQPGSDQPGSDQPRSNPSR